MTEPIVLASGSQIRAELLQNARVPFAVERPRVDEEAVKQSLMAEAAPPRDIADALAGLKAAKVSARRPDALVIGCDQVLDFKGRILSKPADMAAARAQVEMLRGQTHKLLSAAVIYQAGAPLWRHVGQVRLTMHDLSDDWLTGYIARNWPGLGDSVGGYKLEEEGVRLFSRIEGDYFTVLGLPLLDLLSYLKLRGTLPS